MKTNQFSIPGIFFFLDFFKIVHGDLQSMSLLNLLEVFKCPQRRLKFSICVITA